LTSHGMPPSSVQRDPADNTIITKHITREISPLPSNVAANEHTGFSILGNEVKQMALTEQDRTKLEALGVDPDRLEAETETKAKETEGLEYKETKQPEAQAGDYVSRDEVGDLIKSIAGNINQMTEIVGGLVKRVEALETGNSQVEKEILERTPAASLNDLYKSVIGSEEAAIDGRTSLAKAGPKEAEAPNTSGSRFGGGIAAVIAQRNREIEQGGMQ